MALKNVTFVDVCQLGWGFSFVWVKTHTLQFSGHKSQYSSCLALYHTLFSLSHSGRTQVWGPESGSASHLLCDLGQVHIIPSGKGGSDTHLRVAMNEIMYLKHLSSGPKAYDRDRKMEMKRVISTTVLSMMTSSNLYPSPPDP